MSHIQLLLIVDDFCVSTYKNKKTKNSGGGGEGAKKNFPSARNLARINSFKL